MAPVVRVIGCGRWSMGDDQAGLLAAEALAARNLPDTVVTASESPGVDLADLDPQLIRLLILVDATPADSLNPPGSVRRLDYRPGNPEGSARVLEKPGGDTHSIGVLAGIRLAEALGSLPETTWIYVVFGTEFGRCLELTGPVERGVSAVVVRVEVDVREWLGR